MDDPFWKEFFPPNGWNCRCEAIQVSKKRYDPSNPSEALACGSSATYKPNAEGQNKAAIFCFNPGLEHIIFMNRHPYFKTNDAKRIRSILSPNEEYTRNHPKTMELFTKQQSKAKLRKIKTLILLRL